MFKKCIIFILIIISFLLIFLSNNYWTDQKPYTYWLYNTVTPEQYDLANNVGYEYTKQDNETIKQFISENINLLSNLKRLEDFEEDSLFYVQRNVPKETDVPVTSATLHYTYVIKKPNNAERGIFAYYYSYLFRNDEKSLWNKVWIYVDMENIFSFTPKDFQDVGLNFKRKYYLQDLPREEQIKYDLTLTVFDDMTDQKVYDHIAPTNYAFYVFETVRNGHKLKATFVVSMKKEFENKASGLPLSWHTLYITRES